MCCHGSIIYLVTSINKELDGGTLHVLQRRKSTTTGNIPQTVITLFHENLFFAPGGKSTP